MKPMPTILAIVISILVSAGNGRACSCGGNGTPEQELEKSRAVFVGTVTDVEDQLSWVKKLSFWIRVKYADLTHQYREPEWDNRRFGYAITFEVHERFKGKLDRKVTLVTGRSAYGGGGGDCSIGLVVGKKYLIYVNPLCGNWYDIDICSRTSELFQAGVDLSVLRGLRKGR